jgi:hypothetical protein
MPSRVAIGAGQTAHAESRERGAIRQLRAKNPVSLNAEQESMRPGEGKRQAHSEPYIYARRPFKRCAW